METITERHVLNYLQYFDPHIANVFEWINRLDDLAEDVRSSDNDEDLEDDLRSIINRLEHEFGFRTLSLLKERCNESALT